MALSDLKERVKDDENADAVSKGRYRPAPGSSGPAKDHAARAPQEWAADRVVQGI